MKKILYSFLLGISVMGATRAAAQCPAGRYDTELFPTYSVSTVTYSTPYNLQMDIYQPDGDTYPNRPLMILGHGGSFIGGSKTDDPTIVELCKRFAKRGYVTASINYRLGDLFSMAADSNKAISIVVKAISDGKAAIRYFMKDAYTSNTYHIDTNNIFVGGNSAGAVLYMHVGYLGSMAEVPSYIADTMLTNGGFEGNSGNEGYNVKVRGIINLAGALNSTSFINYNDKPSVNAQGTADNTVPYNCAYPLSGVVHVNLCGMGQLESVMATQNIYHMTRIYDGEGHVPWSSNAVMLNSVDSMVEEFCYNIICDGAAAVKETKNTTQVSLYPNPATGSVNISAGAALSAITICDQTGRTLHTITGIRSNSYTVNTGAFAPGLYFVRATFADGNVAPIVKQLVIQ
ncbi:hypothetical protein GCM10023093_26880 [Nemorincola caseinilytica]|uniref:T9SS C-terminal target domain-containing protein n=1 Tax=Nemorincola caseinilytica TaxID=2054315 RepID=A0ABP8NNE3_9BACT